LRYSIIRFCSGFSCYARDGLDRARCDCAGNAVDEHFNVIKTGAFEAPARKGNFLTSSGVSRCGTDTVDLWVSANVPAIITCKVAMHGAVTKEGITGTEAHFGDLITRVLVT